MDCIDFSSLWSVKLQCKKIIFFNNFYSLVPARNGRRWWGRHLNPHQSTSKCKNWAIHSSSWDGGNNSGENVYCHNYCISHLLGSIIFGRLSHFSSPPLLQKKKESESSLPLHLIWCIELGYLGKFYKWLEES